MPQGQHPAPRRGSGGGRPLAEGRRRRPTLALCGVSTCAPLPPRLTYSPPRPPLLCLPTSIAIADVAADCQRCHRRCSHCSRRCRRRRRRRGRARPSPPPSAPASRRWAPPSSVRGDAQHRPPPPRSDSWEGGAAWWGSPRRGLPRWGPGEWGVPPWTARCIQWADRPPLAAPARAAREQAASTRPPPPPSRPDPAPPRPPPPPRTHRQRHPGSSMIGKTGTAVGGGLGRRNPNPASDQRCRPRNIFLLPPLPPTPIFRAHPPAAHYSTVADTRLVPPWQAREMCCVTPQKAHPLRRQMRGPPPALGLRGERIHGPSRLAPLSHSLRRPTPPTPPSARRNPLGPRSLGLLFCLSSRGQKRLPR